VIALEVDGNSGIGDSSSPPSGKRPIFAITAGPKRHPGTRICDQIPCSHHAAARKLSLYAGPTSVDTIGLSDPANHPYDFFDVTKAGNMPAVAFLKAQAYQDGHAQYSDPLDEQTFLVDTINFLMQRPERESTVVFIAYDDSDGWYDHRIGPIIHHSQTTADTLTGSGMCGSTPPADGQQGRCG
jgi:hypothetical protein